ncbi:SDR family oxidoreductase [Alginatibacterium sediminis]|uniref:SDR family oxidoreductase n=1 Tax=Alginatibacterium sediminis TaxID=2164068 RepID=A0A420EGF2_9ALTE|nr:SDR family NAD(P)-dependent oxidoreductase [Alginatibacterium sediminis]RKF19779.1 SDR family oxidoreductase [Alginatibacterium sediminis]
MSTSIDLKQQVAIVTGAARGLGLAQAKALLDANAKVVITDLDADALASAKASLDSPNVYTYVQNVKDFEATPGFVQTIEDEVGPIAFLVNNAGVHLKKPIWEVELAEFQNINDINVTGVFMMSREVAKRMMKREFGSIVNISSMGGLMALPGATGYVTTKTAIVGLTRSMAVDLGPYNIRTNALCPGFIDTEMTRKVLAGDPQRAAKINGRIPMPRLGLGEDIANATVFLCSEQGGYINGQLLPIDGGYSVGF